MKTILIFIGLLISSFIYGQLGNGQGFSGGTFKPYYVNVRSFGARGDSTTNDSAAIVNAINSTNTLNYGVYFPNGVYSIGSITLPTNMILRGDHVKLNFISGRTGYMITMGTNTKLSGLWLEGGNRTAEINPNGSRSAIYVNGVTDVVIENCKIYGFDNRGIDVAGQVGWGTYCKGIQVNECDFQYNFRGIFSPEYNEYMNLNASTFLYNRYGMYLIGGNNKINGCQIGKNTFGLYLGNGNNEGHSVCTNTQFNHNSTYALYVSSQGLGYIFNGCTFYEGYLGLIMAKGFVFDNCLFGYNLEILLQGGGLNKIVNSFIDVSVTVTHDYGGIADSTILKDNVSLYGWSASNNTDVTIDADTTLRYSWEKVLVDATSEQIDVALPTASSYRSKEMTIKKTDSSANTVVITRAGSSTIDGATSHTLTAQYEYVILLSDGTNWHILGEN